MSTKGRRVPKKSDPRDDDTKKEVTRGQQAQGLVHRFLLKQWPQLTKNDVQVLWAHPARGQDDWRAVVMVSKPETTLYMVGYNKETDTLYIDTFRNVLVRRYV